MPRELAISSEAVGDVLDSLTARIAVLDRQGAVIAANDAWRRSGIDDPAVDRPEAARGIADVLEGRRERFVHEYELHDPNGSYVIHVTPLRRPEGGAVVAHYDITERKRAERERQEALERERRARDRASFLADVSQVLERSLDLRVVCSELARLAALALQCSCMVDLLDGPLVTVRASVGREDAENSRALAVVADLAPALLPDGHPVMQAARTRRLVSNEDVTDDELAAAAVDERHLEAARLLGTRSYACMPLIARGAVIGAVTLHSSRPSRFADRDLADLRELAGRAALAVDNARLYSERTQTVRALQSSLLPPRLSPPAGFTAAARYHPGAGGMEVGGDFYDAFPARDDAWGVTIGDVCGKGAEAAALTTLARHTLRTAARYEGSTDAVLGALNHAVLAERGDMRFLTAAYAELTPKPGGGALLRCCTGGHPPPVVLRAGGGVEAAAEPGTLIGVIDDPDLLEVEVELGPGDALVFYTDGVTEAAAPNRQLTWEDVGTMAGGAAGDADDIAGRLEDEVHRLARGAPDDDVALLVVKV